MTGRPAGRQSDVTVVVPTFDEAGNLERLIAALRGFGVAVLIVDDNSPDGTGAIADRLASADPGVSVLHRSRKEGIGPAYAAGFSAAIAAGATVVCQMDADLSHDPADLPRLLAAVSDGAELAIGSRYVPGGSTVGWPRYRMLLSRAGNRYASGLLGMAVADATAGFRAWAVEALAVVDPGSCASSGYGFQVETAWRAVRRGLRVVELPIVFRERTVGASKMTPQIAFEAMWLVTRIGVANRLAEGLASLAARGGRRSRRDAR